MTAILLVLFNLSELPIDLSVNAQIIEKTSSSMKIDLTFLEAPEDNWVTRFIISKTPPIFDFSILKSDTTYLSNTKNRDANPIRIGNPIKLRNYNIYPIIVKPVIQNGNMAISCHQLQLSLQFDSYVSVNLPILFRLSL